MAPFVTLSSIHFQFLYRQLDADNVNAPSLLQQFFYVDILGVAMSTKLA